MNKQRRKRCKSCNELFTPKFNTLQMVCSSKCAIVYSKELKRKKREQMQLLKKQDEQRKKLPKALASTQMVFNKYIRLRDIGKPCISSLITWKKDFDAGHLFSVKQHSALRFNEDNVHAQSIQDNRFKEGNFEQYLLNVRYRIGDDRFHKLLKLAEKSKREVHKWTLEELQEIKEIYKAKIKELQKSNKVFH